MPADHDRSFGAQPVSGRPRTKASGTGFINPINVEGRGRLGPKAAELGAATGRQQSGVHRTCCRRSREGSL